MAGFIWRVTEIGNGDGGLPLSGLAQYGASGVILSIALTFFWLAYKRERDKADSKEAEIRRLNDLLWEKAAPSLERATAALKEAAEALAIDRDRNKRRP
jgi:hypothetical protein